MDSEATVFDFIGDESDCPPGMLEMVRAYQRDSEATGGLILQSQAAVLLELSTARVAVLVNEGRFKNYEHFGKRLVGAEEVIAFGKMKRKSGGGAAQVKLQKQAWEVTKKELSETLHK